MNRPDKPASESERVRALRLALRLSQRELAEEWGLSPTAIAKWETGSNPVPGPVRKLLEIYEHELAARDAFVERDSNFLTRGFNGIVAYGTWVFFRRTFGIAGVLPSAAAHDALARQFANHLAKHRGVLMKLGQRALYLDRMLSPRERDALAKLRDHARPMSTATVQRIFRETFGKEPRALFTRWDPRPARRGSIGQVHRARIEGREVAVKVQYPDSRSAIEADLTAGSLMDRWLTTMWPAQEPGVVFEEIRARFLEECDYAKEAQTLRRFRAFWRDDPRVVIPDVIDELTRGPILTMEWCGGVHWEDWIPTARVAERVTFAELVWDFYWGSLYAHGMLNVDPHTSNFLFLPSSTACIDFGCTKVLDPAFHVFFKDLSRATCEGRWLDTWNLAVERGLARPDGEPDIIPRVCAWMLLPMLVEGPFRITAEYLEGLLDTLKRPAIRKTTSMSRDTLFLHQVQLAVSSILTDLDVRVDYRSRFVALLYPDREPPKPLSAGELAAFGIDLARLGARS